MKLSAFALLLLLSAAAHATPNEIRDCPTCPVLVTVPGGSFAMGSPESEAGREPQEGPVHKVTIRSFALGKYDVTRAEWERFVADTDRAVEGGCSWATDSGPKPDPAASWRNLNFQQDDMHPVVCVSWRDAQDYVAWLSRKTGHGYRLPSEAEWEYAARGGTTTPFPWGAVATHEQANYGTETCCTGLASGRDAWFATSPVGSFAPNAFGLFDMHGNVMQWVQDCLHDYRDAKADGSAYEISAPLKADGTINPKLAGLDSCAFRMLRGGDWGDPPRMLRSAFRNFAPPRGSTIDKYRSGGAGFRVARSLD